jgi:hypothetical protein
MVASVEMNAGSDAEPPRRKPIPVKWTVRLTDVKEIPLAVEMESSAERGPRG